MNVATFIDFIWSMPNDFTDTWSWRKTGLRLGLTTRDFQEICIAYAVHGTNLEADDDIVAVSMTNLAKISGYTIEQVREARNILTGLGIFTDNGKQKNITAYRLTTTDLVEQTIGANK